MGETTVVILRIALVVAGVAAAVSILRRRVGQRNRQEASSVRSPAGEGRRATPTPLQPAELAARWERIRIAAVRVALGLFALVLISLVVDAPVDVTTVLVIGTGASMVAYWIASVLSGWYEGKASMKE